MFSLLICLGSTEFLALSVFTVTETVCPKMWEKPPAKNAKSLLPFDVCRSKTSKLKLAIRESRLRQTEVINSKRQLMEKLDHVVQIHVCRLA